MKLPCIAGMDMDRTVESFLLFSHTNRLLIGLQKENVPEVVSYTELCNSRKTCSFTCAYLLRIYLLYDFMHNQQKIVSTSGPGAQLPCIETGHGFYSSHLSKEGNGQVIESNLR